MSLTILTGNATNSVPKLRGSCDDTLKNVVSLIFLQPETRNRRAHLVVMWTRSVVRCSRNGRNHQTFQIVCRVIGRFGNSLLLVAGARQC